MQLAIIGTGKMGTAIFQWAVDRDVGLVLCGRREENLRQQEGRFRRKLDRAVRGGDMTEAQADARRARVRFTTRLGEIAGADFALETIPEDPALKIPVLRELEQALGPQALLFSNTSSISLGTLAEQLKRPAQFCGLHFFYPVMVVPLVEIITWSGVASDTVERAAQLCHALGRDPLVVADGPGSPLNWILACLYVEGLYLLEEGAVLPDRLDRVARRFFSPGPCEAIDTLGIEIILQGLRMFTQGVSGKATDWLDATGRELTAEEAAGRSGFRVPWLFSRLYHDKRLGRKAGRGVFVYSGDQTLNDDPSFYLRPRCSARALSDDEVEARLFYAVYTAALHSLSRELCSAAALDRGLKEILLMQEGPLRMAERRGAERVRTELAALESLYGKRFHPLMPPEEVALS